MSDRVILVTAPDDIGYDGVRILLVDLTPDQTQVVSEVLTRLNTIPTTILYVTNTVIDSADWIFDKKHKSDLIIFNADSENDLYVGYFAAQPNSHYFGTLKVLSVINNQAIYDTEECVNLLENLINKHEQTK